jgi:phage-related protein
MGIGGETVARLKAVVTVDNTGLKKGLAEGDAMTKSSAEKRSGMIKKAGQVSAIGFALVGAAVFEGVKGAIALDAKMKVLDSTLRHAGISAKNTGDAGKYLEDQSNKTGFAIGDLTDGFGKAATALGSYKKAQQETVLAENIARATGESLTMANKQATKVFEGKNTALSRLGVKLDTVTTAQDKLKNSGKKYTTQELDAAKKTDAHAQALLDAKEAMHKYQGSTDAYNKSLAGQMQLLKTRFQNLLDQLGKKLLPVITSVFGYMSKHTNVLLIVGGAIVAIWAACTLVTGAMAAWSAATKIAAAMQWLLNAAMDANPIGLAILAIGLLVGALILAYKHVGAFRNIVNDAWDIAKHAFNGIKNAASAVFGWIKQHWPLLLGIMGGPFGLLIAIVATHFGQIKNAAQSVISAVTGFFKGLPGKIGSALSGAAHDVASGARAVGSAIISAIKSSFVGLGSWILHEIESDIPGKGVIKSALGAIGLATGGIVGGRPNGGRDSILTMLAPGEMVLNQQQQGRLASMLFGGGHGGGHGGAVTVVQNMYVTNPDQGSLMRSAKFAASHAFA